MDEKKAFIFDTNFIIQNQQLDEVIDNLDESYSVYVTQVSIDERIAQNCRELKKQYAEVERCQQEYAHFVTVKLKKRMTKNVIIIKRAYRQNTKSFLQIE